MRAAETNGFKVFAVAGAYGMNDLFKDVFRTSSAPFRLALMEKKTRSVKAGQQKEAEEEAIHFTDPTQAARRRYFARSSQ